MNHGAVLVPHIATNLGKLVHDARNSFLIARNGRRGNDDRVAFVNLDGLMLAVRDTGKRRKRLALATRTHNNDLLRRNALQVIGVDKVDVLNLQITQATCDIGVLNHRTARDHDFAAARDSRIGDLLQAVDMACKARDNDAALGVLDNGTQRLAHFSLRRGEVRVRGIRRVAHHEVDAHFRETRERSEVGANTVNRGSGRA